MKVDEPHNPRVRPAEHHRELTEVLVERDEDSRFTMGELEDRVVAGVGVPVTRPDRVVTRSRQCIARSRGNARVEQGFSSCRVDDRWLDTLTTNEASCVQETRADVVSFKERVLFQ